MATGVCSIRFGVLKTMAGDTQGIQLADYGHRRAVTESPDRLQSGDGDPAFWAQAEGFQPLRYLRRSARLLESRLRVRGNVLRQSDQLIAARLNSGACRGFQVRYLRASQVEILSSVNLFGQQIYSVYVLVVKSADIVFR